MQAGRWRAAAALALGLATIPAAPPAHAQLLVSPVRFHLAPRHRVVSLYLTNRSAEPVVIQSELFDWQQAADGKDLLEPTEDIVVTPPILTIPAGASRVLRMARLTAEQPDVQRAYRLLLHQEARPDDDAPRDLHLQFGMTYSIPIFVTPRAPRQDVQCEAQPPFEAFECRNTGNTFARITRAAVRQGEQAVAQAEGTHYLLPGASRRVPLKALGVPVPGAARLTVQFEDESERTSSSIVP